MNAEASRNIAQAASAIASIVDSRRLQVLGVLATQSPRSLPVSELAELSGFDLHFVALTCAKLANAGLIQQQQANFAYVPAEVRRFVEALDNAQPTTAKLEGYPALQGLFAHGRLMTWPNLGTPSHSELLQLACAFLKGPWPMNEAAVSEQLSIITDDPVQLRRLLVDGKMVVRTKDGSEYTPGPRRGAEQ